MPDQSPETLRVLSAMGGLPIEEAIAIVFKTLTEDPNVIGLNDRLRRLNDDHYRMLITAEQYEVKLAGLRASLNHFLSEFKPNDLEKLSSAVRMNNRIITMLYIAASPKDAGHLQTENEFAAIKRSLDASFGRQNFKLPNPMFATTIEEMVNSINSIGPNIIHFSGHAGKRGIILSNRNNAAEVIPIKILDDLFGTFDKTIRCVFLNACYSAKQAEAISKHADYVIGMNQPVGDTTAMLFSESFYQSIFNGASPDYEKSFKQAKIQLQFRRYAESKIPEIWKAGTRLHF
jgi:hypothetical protein